MTDPKLFANMPTNMADFAIGEWTGIDADGNVTGVLYGPRRIQRKRSKGWKMPPNTVYVGRPTEWGNSFTIGQPFVRRKMQAGGGEISGFIQNAEEAVHFYRRFLSLEIKIAAGIHLKGKNLACWCSIDQPCHADVLLEVANA